MYCLVVLLIVLRELTVCLDFGRRKVEVRGHTYQPIMIDELLTVDCFALKCLVVQVHM
jgi:hypothetical protein